jgi:4-diphosphocytidyl-2-C-methyl-D-erythritol kinase
MVIFPRAKINIGLRVTERRSDGFHNLETIFYPAGLCDALEFVVADKFLKEDLLIVTGSLVDVNPDSNMVIKAVRKIREIQKIPFLRIHLHKAIPAGAGLGGGSSDASALLKAVNKYFDLKIDDGKLKEMALDLGSDCPFFIDSIPSFAHGRGEILTPVKQLPEGLHLVLVNPGIHLNTREAYSNITPGQPDSNLRELYDLDVSKWKDLIFNDFEASVFKKHPQIAEIKKRLYEIGAAYSSMSGSGSTVYGIFCSKPEIPESFRKMVIYSDVL